MQNQITVSRLELKNTDLDIGERDIVIGFSEPAFNYDFDEGKLGAILNARLLSYFLPAVEIAKKQKRRPRLLIISGIKAAIKWNCNNEYERKIMLVNNNIKKDFLNIAFNHFFPDVFSIIDIRDTIDFLKIPDSSLSRVWEKMKVENPEKVLEIKQAFERFRKGSGDSEKLYKYALIHLFGLGDVNFDWEPHRKEGYCSIGEHNELLFNEIRKIAIKFMREEIKRENELDIQIFNNLKVVVLDNEKVPPPYNGSHRSVHGKKEIDEATYENGRLLSYYQKRPRLKGHMDYLYTFIPQENYEKFWSKYRSRYFDLKKRYFEAYSLYE